MALTLISDPIINGIYKWNTKDPLVFEFDTTSTGDNYVIKVEFYDLTDTLIYPDPFFFTPKSDGSLRIDVSDIMGSKLDGVIDLTTFPQTELSENFYIIATEQSSAGSGDTVQSNPVAIVLANNQFQEFSNLREYTPIVNQSSGGFSVFNQGQFLTRFEEPSLWIGWPSSVFVIANSNVLTPGTQRALRERSLDVNKNQILKKDTPLTDDLIVNEINRLPLTETKLDATEKYRTVSVIIGISLKQVIDQVNANGWGPVTTMREAGAAIEANTAYTRTPPGTGPDSLLEMAFYL